MYNTGRTGRLAQSSHYLPQTGVITSISNQNNDGCSQIFTLEDKEGNITHFVITPQTYFIDHQKAAIGMTMTAFYDANLPAILIYPPQFTAVAANLTDKNVKIDRFNQNLISQDGSLKINISPNTQVILPNGQTFHGSLKNRNLVVVYGPSTRSIPAQTTPEQVIVLC